MGSERFVKELNQLLVSTYQTIEKMERKMICKGSAAAARLSMAEIHLIEAVGRGKERKTISAIAERLNITLASVTVGVNKLVKKELLQKKRSEKDGRVIYVSLTSKGRAVYQRHTDFHMSMVKYIALGLTKEEQYAMLRGIQKLRNFFAGKTEG